MKEPNDANVLPLLLAILTALIYIAYDVCS